MWILYILGHMVYGYILSTAASKALRVKTSFYVLFLAPAIPDFDLYFMNLGLAHHTYSHSIIIWAPIFVVLFAFSGRTSIPYTIGIAQHFLLDDFLVGRVPLFLPLSGVQFGLSLGSIGRNEMALEVGAFIVAAIVAYRMNDIREALTINRKNITMVIPLFALVSLTLLFANEIHVNLLDYGFASGSVSLISISHVVLALFLAMSFGQGVRGLSQKKASPVTILVK